MQSEMVTGIKPAESHYNDGLNILRFWLMPFVCFASFSPALPNGTLISKFCLFAPNAFYILCGYAISLRSQNTEGAYGRAVKRTAVNYLFFLVSLLIFNAGYYAFIGQLSVFKATLLSPLAAIKWFVFCTWPLKIGDTIWFLQALLFARIILWFMDKYNLMRYYKIVLAVTTCIMLLFGEFAGIIHLSKIGIAYIPGNAITRALPYMLLGRLVYEYREKLFSVKSAFYMIGFLLGIAVGFLELYVLDRRDLLVYSNHMIGYGVMAFCACCLFLKINLPHGSFAVLHGRTYSWRIYFLSQPVGFAYRFMLRMILKFFPWVLSISPAMPQVFVVAYSFSALFIYFICLGLAYIIGFITFSRFIKEKNL